MKGIAGGKTFKVRGKMGRPPKASPTGEVYKGAVVFKERVAIRERRMQRDEDGTALYHLNPDGTKRAPKWENVVVGYKEQEFIEEDAGNGIVRKIYNFRPTAEEAAKATRERVRAERLEKMGAVMERMTPEQAERLFSVLTTPEAPEAPQAGAPPAPEPAPEPVPEAEPECELCEKLADMPGPLAAHRKAKH